ncbi:Tail fiber protein [Enterococcus phage phiEF24C] [Rhizoctonia solani]|uniref:Tail fiber protein [Enterococcus phage phiEF24C] n=1 Tax=Rhizoctonia solani TaxID=456999 RepID=A0A0K6GGZ1_9AGAM|nr:Tail fiber protein [Enterococcus phage phiEF24C] [Rhizoctonia solani]
MPDNPGAIQSQDQLAHARNNNIRREYGREIAARLPPPAVSNPLTDAPLRNASSHRQNTASDEEDDNPITEDDFAEEFLKHLCERDAQDFRARYYSGEMSLEDLRNRVLVRSPHGSTALADHVSQPAPVGPGPIATDLRGNNAWPGITVVPQEGAIVQSRFVGDGYDLPVTNVSTNHPVSQPSPLRRTDVDTIVPGSPHPTPPPNHAGKGKAPARSVLASHALSGAGNAPITPTQQQTPRHVAPVRAPAAPMTPTAPRFRKDLPPRVRNAQATGLPVLGTTPTNAPATACTGPTLAPGSNIHSVGHNIHGGRGNIHFATYNNANNTSSGNQLYPSRQSNGRLGLQPQVGTPASNPFLDSFGPYAPTTAGTLPTGQDIPSAGNGVHVVPPVQPLSMTDGSMPMLARQPPITRNDVPGPFAQPADTYMPQGPAQPQVVYPPFQPPAHAAQPHTQLPLPTGYGNAQDVPPTFEHPGVPHYAQGNEGTRYAYGLQYDNILRARNTVLPEPCVRFPGARAPAYRQATVLVPPQVAPQVVPQAALNAFPHGPTARIGVLPAVVPPGAPMEAAARDGNVLVADRASEDDEPNLKGRPSTIRNHPVEVRPVLKTFVAIFKVSSVARGTYPFQGDQDQLPREDTPEGAWEMANEKHRTNFPFKVEYLKPVDAALCNFRTAATKALRPQVEQYFGLRPGEPERNIEVKNRMLPHGIHEGIPEEGRKPMQSAYLRDACRFTLFSSKRAIGFRNPEKFGPLPGEVLALICTLTHHEMYAYRNGECDMQDLNATQQEAMFEIYMVKIKWMREHKPIDLQNVCMSIWDYCMRSLVQPDPRQEITPPPRECSPDATELYESEFSSRLPPRALEAARATRRRLNLPGQAAPGEVLPGSMGPEGDHGDADMDMGEGGDPDEQPWEIFLQPDAW